MIEDKDFNEYINSFKALTIDRKKELTVREMKKLYGFINLLKDKFGVPQELLYNREILDAKGDLISEDDFVEAMFVYANIVEEAFADYVDYSMKKENI